MRRGSKSWLAWLKEQKAALNGVGCTDSPDLSWSLK